jgi:[ribosomal protein S5]-alanine N-acetyltransferase
MTNMVSGQAKYKRPGCERDECIDRGKRLDWFMVDSANYQTASRDLKAPSLIETARLRLRRPLATDAAAIFERYSSDPEVTRFLSWSRHQSIADTHAFLKFSDQEWERWPAAAYLIISRKDGRLLGSTGLSFEAKDQAATGYALARDAWGHGYATEALRAMIDVARSTNVVRLYALCHPQHQASRHVLEKAGFSLDRTWTKQTEFPNLAPGVSQDVVCYALILNGSYFAGR